VGEMTSLGINIKKRGGGDLETLRSESGPARNVRIEINLDIPLKSFNSMLEFVTLEGKLQIRKRNLTFRFA
jgi:hypothetical protein